MNKNNKEVELKYSTVFDQVEALKSILSGDKLFMKVLKVVQKARPLNWYIGGGAIPQIVWNHLHKFDLSNGIKDFDIVYFDDSDLSKKREQNWSKRINTLYSDCPIELEVVNEARVHIWYERDYGRKFPPYTSTEDAIMTFPTTASAIGVTLGNNEIKVFAPFGLSDLFGMIVRPNKTKITKEVFEKKSKRWKEVWPKLSVVPWRYQFEEFKT